jgi:hypothetical protein
MPCLCNCQIRFFREGFRRDLAMENERSLPVYLASREVRFGRRAVQAFADWAESHKAPGFTRSGYIASICR